MPSRLLARLVPAAFVVIWATGFVVARLVAPYIEPLTFLTIRYVLAGALLVAIAVAGRARWPATPRGWTDALVAGILLHGVYLAGVFWSVRHGLPAGISALIAGTQPLITALVAEPLLGESVSGRRWAGIGVGFAGVTLVIAPRLAGAAGFGAAELAACTAGVVGLSLGTIWHKSRAGGLDLRTGTALQFLGALAVTLPLALATETGTIVPAPPLFVGLAWAVLGLSIGAIALLLLMLRQGAVVGVASLMFLVPPVAAVMSFVLFGETLLPVQLVGMGLAAIGVAVASRS